MSNSATEANPASNLLSSLSCSDSSNSHDTPDPDELKREALALLNKALVALAKWRNAVESQGVLQGQLHSYPHRGKTRYNYYPDSKDGGKRRRQYVSQDRVKSYRADIARGKTCKAIHSIEDQIATVMREAKVIA